ncbi:hypothetical protein ACFPK9_01930 [Rubritalea spongiae]|uniref:Uncharacterized protein n=1 Tax=Rubritalea spongiae TaxID=430797 RepID=A0ABW5E6N3_9BACT
MSEPLNTQHSADHIHPCPYLPAVTETLPSTHTRPFRAECSQSFYNACHELAQSQWLQARPAQAILQLDKAMMAKLPADTPILSQLPIPYQPILWIIEHSAENAFLGNPVRHFQHLASRMNWKQPQPELRIARAWCCLHLCEARFSTALYPRDFVQIEREQLHVPSFDQALQILESTSPHTNEVDLVKQLCQ